MTRSAPYTVPPRLLEVVRSYRRAAALPVAHVFGTKPVRTWGSGYPWSQALRRGVDLGLMARESARWGEPTILLDRHGLYVWGAPITDNNLVTGGLFAAEPAVRGSAGAAGDGEPDAGRARWVTEQAWNLMDRLVAANLCNEALMRWNRTEGRTHARRAEAIHAAKSLPCQDPREIYLREEGELLAAIRDRDRERARAAANRVLLGVYHLGLRDLDVLKTLVLEMVVMMNRSAVDRGADPRGLLALTGQFLRELASIRDEERLAHWLTSWLEAFIGTPFRATASEPQPSLAPVLEFMRENLDRPIRRAEAAEIVHLSQSHFSRLFARRLGATFAETLTRFRLERACELLERPTLRLGEIAEACGFSDPSHFSKVFHKSFGMAPREYRKRLLRRETDSVDSHPRFY